jgi:hypothetical protein
MKNTGVLFVLALLASIKNCTAKTLSKSSVIHPTKGVSEAGMERIDSLANLEALLNHLCSGVEVIGIGAGLFFIIKACRVWKKSKLSTLFNLTMALMFIVCGMTTRGALNWLISSARDTCCFS